MKLYRVTAAYDIYVYTNSEKEAEQIATKALREDISYCGAPDVITSPINSIVSVEPAWRQSVPFGNFGDDITIGEILARQQKEAKKFEPNLEIEDDE